MLDLFGEIVVTFERYVRLWDVAGKVRAAKAAGTFESTIERHRARRAHLARRFGITP